MKMKTNESCFLIKTHVRNQSRDLEKLCVNSSLNKGKINIYILINFIYFLFTYLFLALQGHVAYVLFSSCGAQASR